MLASSLLGCRWFAEIMASGVTEWNIVLRDQVLFWNVRLDKALEVVGFSGIPSLLNVQFITGLCWAGYLLRFSCVFSFLGFFWEDVVSVYCVVHFWHIWHSFMGLYLPGRLLSVIIVIVLFSKMFEYSSFDIIVAVILVYIGGFLKINYPWQDQGD